MIKFIVKIIALSITSITLLQAQNKIRPQDPTKPYNYKSESVYFTNPKADNIKLAGTLTLPKNKEKPAVVILISGSGPQNRDSEIKQFNHRPFLVLSDHLTNQGIAVLRYDDRGVSESEGTQENATSEDFATDVEAAVNYLKTRNDINTTKIGLIGHSEGGLIAPIVASKIEGIAFTVLLAAPGVTGDMILETQSLKALTLMGAAQEYIDESQKFSRLIFNIIKKYDNTEVIKSEIISEVKNYKTTHPDSPITKTFTEAILEKQINVLTSSWMQYFIKTDPKQFLEKVTCPVLALNGSKDFQVIPKLNLEAIETILKNTINKDITIKELEGLNHLFQTAETGSMQEYKTIDETFSPSALKIISSWINNRF